MEIKGEWILVAFNPIVGSAVSLEPLREAHRMGYRVGTLCASEMGEGVYRKMGFRAYCPLRMYLWVNQ